MGGGFIGIVRQLRGFLLDTNQIVGAFTEFLLPFNIMALTMACVGSQTIHLISASLLISG